MSNIHIMEKTVWGEIREITPHYISVKTGLPLEITREIAEEIISSTAYGVSTSIFWIKEGDESE